MSTYTDAGTSVKGLFESNKFTKSLLSLDLVITFVALALLLVNSISSIGGLLYAVAFWGFLIGLVLTFANLKTQMLYLCMFGYAIVNIIQFFRLLFTKYTGFGWFQLAAIAIFGFLGYILMKQE